MKIEKIICTTGHNGFAHKDLMAIKAGARPNGFLYDGQTVLPGFDSIVQPGQVISIMLVLDDGTVALGDCLDVIFAGAAGRDPVFKPEQHIDFMKGEISEFLRGRTVDSFRGLANEFDSFVFKGKRPHTAIRYGVSQALLHAESLAQKCTMAEIVAREYNTKIGTKILPILISIVKTDKILLDRMIMKKVDLLPHAAFIVVDVDLGRDGQKLIDFASGLVNRIKEIGAPDYRPRIHLDTYGTIGELFGNDVRKIVAYLTKVKKTVEPYPLMIESPVIAKSQAEQIDIYKAMRRELSSKSIDLKLIVDEWCNTLEDIRLFGEAEAADFVQIKVPDLGGLTNSIEAVIFCKSIGMGCCLGGTANETDQSSRITTHVGLATGPDFLLGKPGLGGDEALMIQRNEMARTLALIASR